MPQQFLPKLILELSLDIISSPRCDLLIPFALVFLPQLEILPIYVLAYPSIVVTQILLKPLLQHIFNGLLRIIVNEWREHQFSLVRVPCLFLFLQQRQFHQSLDVGFITWVLFRVFLPNGGELVFENAPREETYQVEKGKGIMVVFFEDSH